MGGLLEEVIDGVAIRGYKAGELLIVFENGFEEKVAAAGGFIVDGVQAHMMEPAWLSTLRRTPGSSLQDR